MKEFSVSIVKRLSHNITNSLAFIQANDGIKHYYYLKDNLSRIRRLKKQGEMFIIGRYNKQIVGFVSIRLVPAICVKCQSLAQIRFLEVDKAFRGMGFGKRLLKKAYVVAKSSKADFIVSHVELDSKKEQYLKENNFNKIGIHSGYYLFKNKKFPASCWVKNLDNIKCIKMCYKLRQPIIKRMDKIKVYMNGDRVIRLY